MYELVMLAEKAADTPCTPQQKIFDAKEETEKRRRRRTCIKHQYDVYHSKSGAAEQGAVLLAEHGFRV